MAQGGPNGKNGPPGHGLSEEDRLLWAEVVRRATPLHGQKGLRSSTAIPESGAAGGPPAGPAPEPPAGPGTAPAPEPARKSPQRPGPARPTDAADPAPVGRPEPGLDRRTADRLRRGERKPDARLDLHGMTAAAAHAALDAFLSAQVGRGARLLLVITGKGGGARGPGLLRDAVPGWLRSGPHGARILRIYEAHPRHGGAGALYVYLRKRG